MEIKNLADCAGNIQKESSSTFVLPEQADSLDLIINEILFDPWPDGVDFVEIYNQSDKFINLNSITIGNDNEIPIAENHFIIEPKQHLAIVEDPIILNNHYPGIDMQNVIKTVDLPGFNNDEGDVFLADTFGRRIDFFHYEENYHSDFLNDIEGVSPERISYKGPTNNPTNWQSAASTAGFATPGKMNSQFIMSGNGSEEITIEPKVFDPSNNGFHDFTTIKCRLQNPGMMATIQILDANGRQIKTIISHKSIGTEEDFKWEGLDENGQEVRMGAYIVFVELYHLSGLRKLCSKKVVVGGRF